MTTTSKIEVNLQPGSKIVEIKNCPTTLEASKLITNEYFHLIIQPLKKCDIIKVLIDEKLIEEHVKEPNNQISDDNFIISYESTVDVSQKIIYWKNGKERNFSINLMNGFSAQMTDFVRNFLIEIVNVEHKASPNGNTLKLIDLVDSKNCNLLMHAVDKNQNSLLISELLRLPFNINQESFDRKTAADIAYEKKNFETLFLLLEKNSLYPKNFNMNSLSIRIKDFLKISENLHYAIKSKNTTQINQIIKENGNLRYFYNANNESAAKIAIFADNYEAYKVLLENNCSIGPNENLVEIINKFLIENQFDEPAQKRIKLDLANANSDASKPLPEKHLMIHYANIVVAHDDQHVNDRVKYIKDAYEILNEIALTRQILKLTAMHRNFKIHFDFNRSSVDFMNPYNTSSSTRGLFTSSIFKKVHLYVAAKELLDPFDKFTRTATLAHELAHFAMHLTFSNNHNPYAVDDYANEFKFNGIVNNCQQQKHKEIIIQNAFDNYHHSEWPCELVVRVPHIIAQYHNDSKRLSELKETFKDLFSYYNDFAVPKITETMKMFEKIYDNTINIKYSDLTDAYKAKIHHSEVEFQGKLLKFNKIVYNKNSEVFQNMTAEKIRRLINNEKIIIAAPLKNYSTDYIERSLIDYNVDTSEKAFNEEISKNFKSFNDFKDEKLIILADHAGAGKTSTFQHFAVKLKESYVNFWISYIDLTQQMKVFEKFEKNINVLKILFDMLAITDEFEQLLYIECFYDNRVILLFDGFDEIILKNRLFFTELIDNIRNSTFNQQWIAIRPKDMLEFKEKVFKLVPLPDHNKIQFIKNILRNHGINGYQIHKNVEKIQKSCVSVSLFLHGQDVNPLTLKIITELYIKDNSLLETWNSYSLFDKIIEIFNEKKSFGSENSKSTLTIWQVHQIFALKLLYSDGFIDCLEENSEDESQTNNIECQLLKESHRIEINNLSLLKKWKIQKLHWSPVAISRYGFFSVINEFPNFIHHTFAEFFIAQFVIENIIDLDENDEEISDNEVEMRIKFLISISSQVNNTNIPWIFIVSYVERLKFKKLNKKIFEFVMSEKMQKYVHRNLFTLKLLEILKILAIDHRFLKEFRINNETIFQVCFADKNLINLHFNEQIAGIYLKSFGAEWIKHTGYPLRDEKL